MTMKKVSGDLAKNRDYLDRQLGVGESFDVLYRNVEIGKKNAALYMIDGFCKDEVMQKLLQHFIGITKEQMPEDSAEMSRQLVPYGEVDLCDDLDEICSRTAKIPTQKSLAPSIFGMETGIVMMFFSVSWVDSLSISQLPIITSEIGKNICVLPQTTFSNRVEKS